MTSLTSQLRSARNGLPRPDSSPAAALFEQTPAAEQNIRSVGLDVHKQQITYCIIDQQGTVLKQGELTLTRERLQAFAQVTLCPSDQVALETTTNSWAVVDILQPSVAEVVVSNPMATKAIAQSKIKTDKVDAHILAQLLRCGFLPTVWQPDPATRQRRQLSGRRASLIGQRTQLQNRIHSVLAMRLIVPPQGTSLFGTKGREWLDALTEETLDADGLLMIQSDLRLLCHFAGELRPRFCGLVSARFG